MDNSYKTDIYSNNIYLKELEKREKLDLEKKESRNKESDKWNRFLNLHFAFDFQNISKCLCTSRTENSENEDGLNLTNQCKGCMNRMKT